MLSITLSALVLSASPQAQAPALADHFDVDRFDVQDLFLPESAGLPRPKVDLLPQLVLPNAQGELVAETDTTPLIRRLEETHSGASAIPVDPVVAMVDALIEDYADEWCWRAALYWRWIPMESGKALMTRIGEEVLSDFPHEALEGSLADQEIGTLLVLADLAKRYSSWAVAMRLLDASGSWGALAGSL